MRASVWTLTAALAIVAVAPAHAVADRNPIDLELAASPFFREQQIEGDGHDNRAVLDAGVVTALMATYRVAEWLDVGAFSDFDAGLSERRTFSSATAGTPMPAMTIDGGYWELWVGVLARARWKRAFFEIGWAPLILRSDAMRDDLPGADGATDGLFLGNPAVAYLVGAGGEFPLTSRLSLTARLRFRIRYLSSRGGEPLEAGQNFGQRHLWPYLGLTYSL